MKLFSLALLLLLPLSTFAADQIIGVGIVLKQENGKTLVEALVPNAPAAREGMIHEGDEIISVLPLVGTSPEWVELGGRQLDETVQLIRGDEGTRVGLHLEGTAGQYESFLIREKIDLP